MLIAQLTDLHIRPRGKAAYRVVESNALTERAFAAVASSLFTRPDLIVLTGDLTDCGLIEEYELLNTLIERYFDGIPVCPIPGNHDRRENFRAVLGHLAGVDTDPEFIQYVVDNDTMPVRLVMLDSVIPGKSHGDLCEKRLEFLERALAQAQGKPTAIFLHHPPIHCGIAHMDEIGLRSADRMADIIRGHANVVGVFCGHNHRTIAGAYAGTRIQVAPSVAHQVYLTMQEGDSLDQFVMEPAAYLLHKWMPRHGLVSHTAFVENYPGPYPIVLDSDYPGD